MVSRPAFVFGGLFLLGLLVQVFFWTHYPYYDEPLWTKAVGSFSSGHLFTDTNEVSGYPATTLLVTADAFVHLGADAHTATEFALAFLITLACAFVGVVAHLLRPRSIAWLAIAGTLLFHHFYAESSLPTAVFIPLAVLFMLLVLYACEHAASKYVLPVLGILSGVVLATRFDLGLALTGSALLFLLWRRGWQALVLPSVLALITLFVLDPYLLLNPLWQFGNTVWLIKTVGSIGHPQSPLPVVMSSSFAFVSFGLALFLWKYRKGELLRIPREVLVWLLATSGVVGVILLVFQSHGIWYFFPFLALWEALLPLLLFPLLEAHPPLYPGTSRHLALVCTGTFILAQALTLVLVYGLLERGL